MPLNLSLNVSSLSIFPNYIISQGCYNKLSQTSLKTTEIYSITVQGTISLKSRHCQCWFLLECMREKPSLPQLLVVAGNLWCSLSWGSITPISASSSHCFPLCVSVSSVSVCFSVCRIFFLKEHQSLALGPIQIQWELNLITSANILFPNEIMF